MLNAASKRGCADIGRNRIGRGGLMAAKSGNSFTEPSLRDLVVALRGVDWHQLGTQLGVPQEELERIDEECHDVSRKLNKMLNYWLKNEEPSWEKIVKALERTGRHGNLITELKFSYCSFPLVSSSSATVISVDDKINMKQSKEVYDRVQQLQHQPTFKVHKSIVNGAMKPADKDERESADSCMCIATQTEVVRDEFSLKFAAPNNDRVKDFQYLIKLDLKELKKKFITLQFEVRESLSKKVPPQKIVAHVLSDYEDIYNDDCKTTPLFSDSDEEKLNSATSVDQVFQILRKYWSFLKCELLYSIVDHCGDDSDRAKVKGYQIELELFFNKRKVSEVPEELTPSSSVDEMREKMVIKLDKENPPWRDITHLEDRICQILGIMPSVLLIIKIQEGCVEITFSIPKHISQLIFSKPLTKEQKDSFREASVLRLSCGHVSLTFYGEESPPRIPHSTTGHTTDHLSRFILEHLGSLEDYTRKHEHACTERNRLQEQFKIKSQEVEGLRSELATQKYGTPLLHLISTTETQISSSEAEIKELKERMKEIEAIIENHERKSRNTKYAITTQMKLLEGELKEVREREQVALSLTEIEERCHKVLKSAEMELIKKIEDLESKIRTLETQLSVYQRTKQSEGELKATKERKEHEQAALSEIEKSYQKSLKSAEMELIKKIEDLESKISTLETQLSVYQHTKQSEGELKATKERKEHEQAALSEIEKSYQKSLKDAEMEYATELQNKNEKIKDLESKIEMLEAQLLVCQPTKQVRQSTKRNRLRKWFKRRKSNIPEPHYDHLPLKYQAQKAEEQDQISYIPIAPPPLYFQTMDFKDNIHYESEVLQRETNSDDSVTVTGYGSEPEDDGVLISLLDIQLTDSITTVV